MHPHFCVPNIVVVSGILHSVATQRRERWRRRGLLLIGDYFIMLTDDGHLIVWIV